MRPTLTENGRTSIHIFAIIFYRWKLKAGVRVIANCQGLVEILMWYHEKNFKSTVCNFFALLDPIIVNGNLTTISGFILPIKRKISIMK